MITSVNVGDKIQPKCSRSYMEIYSLFTYGNVEYISYCWHTEDGSQAKHLNGDLASHVSLYTEFLQNIGSGEHYKI